MFIYPIKFIILAFFDNDDNFLTEGILLMPKIQTIIND